MKIDKTIRPELFVAGSAERRPGLQYVHFDRERGELAATDGHRLIVVPVAGCDDDHEGYVSPAALHDARKLAQRSDASAELRANGVLTTTDNVTRPRPKGGPFPPYRQLLGELRRSPPRATVQLDGRYLADVAKALGARGARGITLHVRGELDPVEITCEAEHGAVTVLVMPMRP